MINSSSQKWGLEWYYLITTNHLNNMEKNYTLELVSDIDREKREYLLAQKFKEGWTLLTSNYAGGGIVEYVLIKES